MTAVLARRVQRLAAGVEALRPTRAELLAAARNKIMNGVADWPDYVLVWDQGIEKSRSSVMRELPLWVALTWDSEDVEHLNLDGCIISVVATPPDQRLRPHLQTMVKGMQHRWRTADNWREARRWAGYRLVLGTDGGGAFRRACWTKTDHDKWQLSDQVYSALDQEPSILRDGVRESFGAAIDEWLLPAIREEWNELVAIDTFYGPTAPHHCLTSVATSLELAVLVDSRPGPPWLSETGRLLLLGQNRSEQVTGGASNSQDVVAAVRDRLIRKTRKLIDERIVIKRQSMEARELCERS